MPARDAKRFVFAHWDGGGNTPPVLAIVRRLVGRGHAVHAVSDPCTREEFESAGATFASWRRPPVRHTRTAESDPLRDWEVQSPPAVIARLRDRILVGPALDYAQDLLEELERHPADAIACNDMMLGAMMAGEHAGVPTVGLSPNICVFPLPGVPPFGTGLLPSRGLAGRLRDRAINGFARFLFGRTADSYNRARASLGLPPLMHPFDQLNGVDRHLILTSEAFDFPATRLPEHIVYTGPELADPAWSAAWSDPGLEPSGRPLVLVGFSTTFQDQAITLHRVIRALAELPVRAIVTTGPALNPADFPAPANVHICSSAPHSELLKQASLMITHAGHGTVIRSLAAGVPLLCMPMGRDQNDNAARVYARGAGLRLPPTADVTSIRNHVTELLNSPRFSERARALGCKIREDAERSRTIDILEEVASRVGQRRS